MKSETLVYAAIAAAVVYLFVLRKPTPAVAATPRPGAPTTGSNPNGWAAVVAGIDALGQVAQTYVAGGSAANHTNDYLTPLNEVTI